VTRIGSVAVHELSTPSLGDRSYLIEDGAVAVVVDPQRDIDRPLELAEHLGVVITHVVETHIHNDYVSGGLALARATGAAYIVNADDPVRFVRHSVVDGDTVDVSASIKLRVVATPGHTHTHLAYLLETDGQLVSVFSGGSLLFGSTGRPDLLGAASTGPLAHAQWRSTRRLAAELADGALVFPTHGFGSFCAAQPATPTTDSSIGREREANPALLLDEDDYVRATLAGLDDFPAYYAHMGAANLAGAAPWDPRRPPTIDATGLAATVSAGGCVVDVRNRRTFAAGYLPGSWNLGIDGPLASYLGWLLPAAAAASTRSDAPGVTLLGADGAQIEEAQRELARIGFARPLAHNVDPGSWTGEALRVLPVADFTDLAVTLLHRPVLVVDVRRRSEWTAGHLDVAVNIPLHELPGRLSELPVAAEIWVHCAAGYRASTAASILANAGRRVVAIDDAFNCAGIAGLSVQIPAASHADRGTSADVVPARG
jgi:hydroxyacylglutathione hydrolase